jgi:hypothetical protein
MARLASRTNPYAPEPNLERKKKDVVWFALAHDPPLLGVARLL